MIEWSNAAINWWTTGLLGVLLYWLPALICLTLYIFRSAAQYQKDKNSRKESLKEENTYKMYVPTLTIGTLIGRVIVSIIPIANLFALTFDLAPEFLNVFFKWLEKTFNIPLVPKYKNTEKSDD